MPFRCVNKEIKKRAAGVLEMCGTDITRNLQKVKKKCVVDDFTVPKSQADPERNLSKKLSAPSSQHCGC